MHVWSCRPCRNDVYYPYPNFLNVVLYVRFCSLPLVWWGLLRVCLRRKLPIATDFHSLPSHNSNNNYRGILISRSICNVLCHSQNVRCSCQLLSACAIFISVDCIMDSLHNIGSSRAGRCCNFYSILIFWFINWYIWCILIWKYC